MDIKEAIKARHSVRQYKDAAISEDLQAELTFYKKGLQKTFQDT